MELVRTYPKEGKTEPITTPPPAIPAEECESKTLALKCTPT